MQTSKRPVDFEIYQNVKGGFWWYHIIGPDREIIFTGWAYFKVTARLLARFRLRRLQKEFDSVES